MFPNWTINAPRSRDASVTFNDDGGGGGGVGGGSLRLWGHEPGDALYQSLSPRCWENAIFSIFFGMMTPICRLHLPSLLTQTGPKRKSRFQVFILSISSIPFSQNGGGGGGSGMGFLFTVASSILMVHPGAAGLAATTVSTLVAGCGETARYHLFADRYTQRWGGRGRKCEGPFILGPLSSGSVFFAYKKWTPHRSSPLTKVVQF